MLNKWRSAGRFAPNAALSAYVSKKTGHPLAGLSASNLSGLGSVAGDIRYFVETNGPNIALDKLGGVIADGNVNIPPEFLDKLLECSCEE